MAKIFRKFRQRVLNSGKFTKYLIYAIGEILLVVIGILIALQINIRNEQAKNKAFEKEMLTQIRANLIKDRITLTDITQNFEDAMASSDKILKGSWTKAQKDSLKFWLGDIVQFDRFQPLTNAYELLKSKGLDQVKNKQLRFLLGTYYDDEVKQMMKSIGDIEKSFNNDWMPILKEEVVDFKFKEFVVIKDFSAFNRSSPPRNLLVLNRDNYRGGMVRIDGGVSTLEKILELIKQELEKG